jgi:membrane-associated PAP2 superfamily phosphatase
MNNLGPTPLFVSGALVAGYAVAALFFLKFWRQTSDRLFGWFAASFLLLMVQRIALTDALDTAVNPLWYYLLRLLAFVLIIVAIIEKNRAASH